MYWLNKALLRLSIMSFVMSSSRLVYYNGLVTACIVYIYRFVNLCFYTSLLFHCDKSTTFLPLTRPEKRKQISNHFAHYYQKFLCICNAIELILITYYSCCFKSDILMWSLIPTWHARYSPYHRNMYYYHYLPYTVHTHHESSSKIVTCESCSLLEQDESFVSNLALSLSYFDLSSIF